MKGKIHGQSEQAKESILIIKTDGGKEGLTCQKRSRPLGGFVNPTFSKTEKRKNERKPKQNDQLEKEAPEPAKSQSGLKNAPQQTGIKKSKKEKIQGDRKFSTGKKDSD